MTEIDPHLERLLGKHLLRSATPEEETELHQAAATNGALQEALDLLRTSQEAFEESSLSQPLPTDARLEALLANPERVRSEVEQRIRHYWQGVYLYPAGFALALWTFLSQATERGWGLATWADPAWWWIPSLVGFGLLLWVEHWLRARSQRERAATGGQDWAALVAAARVPLGWVGLLRLALPSLVLCGAALVIGLPEPAWVLEGLHQGWRHLIGFTLGYLGHLVWAVRFFPHADALNLRLRSKKLA